MSTGRARANHSLYLAKILLAAWRREWGEEVLPQRVLAQAYLPAARQHLLDAYGWFLLEISGASELPDNPPKNCSELPEPPDGKAEAGEIREFRQLEQAGWLAEILRGDDGGTASAVASAGNLAAAKDYLDPEHAQAWADALEACFQLMGDSLDEY